jgi:hypothetical protein
MDTVSTKLIVSAFLVITIIAPTYDETEKLDYSLDVSRINSEPLKDNKIIGASETISNETTIAFESSAITPSIADTSTLPRTELGRKLLELRNKAMLKGMPLLNIDEINLLVEKSRGNEA